MSFCCFVWKVLFLFLSYRHFFDFCSWKNAMEDQFMPFVWKEYACVRVERAQLLFVIASVCGRLCGERQERK